MQRTLVYRKLTGNGVWQMYNWEKYGRIQCGKKERVCFSRTREVLQMPNLIEVQKKSYQWFLDTGLREVFRLSLIHI